MKDDDKVIFNSNDFKANPVNIVCMNIQTMYGADLRLWKTSKKKRSLKTESDEVFEEASSNDGKLEFLTFPTGFSMALEQVP